MIHTLILAFLLIYTAPPVPHPAKDEISAAGITELQKLIKERKGKILVLNVWATWCIPCKEEMPDLNKLAEKNKNIEVVGLSIDYSDEIESKIKPFLKKQPVKFRILVNTETSDEKLINFLSPDWSGAIPATFIYDTKGKLQQVLEGKKSYEEFQAAVKKVKS
jgi:thiol-disulfide isomerase/thioredoxin